jgi:hypothetical protein
MPAGVSALTGHVRKVEDRRTGGQEDRRTGGQEDRN